MSLELACRTITYATSRRTDDDMPELIEDRLVAIEKELAADTDASSRRPRLAAGSMR